MLRQLVVQALVRAVVMITEIFALIVSHVATALLVMVGLRVKPLVDLSYSLTKVPSLPVSATSAVTSAATASPVVRLAVALIATTKTTLVAPFSFASFVRV